MSAKRVLVVGATSAIAEAVARRYAAQGARLVLLARNTGHLASIAADLRLRGAAEVVEAPFDALAYDSHLPALRAAWDRWQGLDVALLAHGTLPDQAQMERSVDAMLESFEVNARSMLALMAHLANLFDAQGHGAIGVISSPAGDRGRASNYVYGAAKAAVTNFASGLRQRLFPRVRVLTILPGFVDTPMTASFRKGPLWATPASVAGRIQRALDGGFGEVYVPAFWRLIMALITHIPERLFVRMRI